MSRGRNTADSVRVLVVDDSRTSRAVLTAVCNGDPGMIVVGEASDGDEAVTMTAKLRPDIVVMDITMPRLDGFEATRRIMMETPTPVVLVTAATDPQSVDIALRTLEAGALTVLAKPSAFLPGGAGEASVFRSRIKLLSDVQVIRRYPSRAATSNGRRHAPPADAAAPKAVAVAASTGGPQALCRFLTTLCDAVPPPPPILIVQHIMRGFVTGLAEWLDGKTSLRVRVARQGEPLRDGNVYFAPDDAHLVCTRYHRAQLTDADPIGGFRPSATALFTSAAEVYGSRLTAVVLTGMGSDGLQGVRVVRERGGIVLAQDEKSSVVFGMPGVVVNERLAHTVAPCDELARIILSLQRGTKP